MDPWWTSQTAGYLGAGIGIAGGVFGTMVGVAGSRLRTPKQFAALRAFMLACAGLGAIAFALGAVGLALGQPYHVWYPLLLFGGMFVVLTLVILPQLRKRLRAWDQRRMQGAELRQG